MFTICILSDKLTVMFDKAKVSINLLSSTNAKKLPYFWSRHEAKTLEKNYSVDFIGNEEERRQKIAKLNITYCVTVNLEKLLRAKNNRNGWKTIRGTRAREREKNICTNDVWQKRSRKSCILVIIYTTTTTTTKQNHTTSY